MKQIIYPTHDHCVRDDPAGTLTAALSSDIDAGRSLLRSAELLADDGGFACWREQFSAWRDRCGRTLHSRFEREAVVEFYGATAIRELPDARWQEVLGPTLRAVEDMVQLLVTLRATLAGRGAPSDRA